MMAAAAVAVPNMPAAVETRAPGAGLAGDPASEGFGEALAAAQTPVEGEALDGEGTAQAAPQQAALAAALGLNGAVVARNLNPAVAQPQVPSLLPAGKLSLMPTNVKLPVAALRPEVAAQGFMSLQDAIRGPVEPGVDLLKTLELGARQDALTAELAHLLSERHGPLPDLSETPEVSKTLQPAVEARSPETPAAAIPNLRVEPPKTREVSPESSAPSPAASEKTAAHAETERPVTATARAEHTLPTASRAEVLPTVGSLTPTASAPAAAPAAPVPTAPYATQTLLQLPPGVEAPAVLRQIGDGLRLMASGTRQTAEIRLDPAELGKVRVRLEIEGKAVRMFVTTENAAIRDVVAQGLDGLRRDLLAQGLQCQHASVEVQADARGFQRQGRDEDEREESLVGALNEDTETAAPPVVRKHAGGRIHLTA